MPDGRNEGHYKSFSDVFRKVTTGEHHPSKKLAKKNSHGIPFNPSKQHAMNTNESNKSRQTTSNKSISENDMRRKRYQLGLYEHLKYPPMIFCLFVDLA